MRCSKCGCDNREGRKFCADCGAPLAAKCARCGAPNEPGERFCGECGTALIGSKTDGSPASRRAEIATPKIDLTREQSDGSSTIEGERKTVTALFADIKGSTELMRDLDPEEARAIVDPALKLMIDAVHRYDGYVVQSTGDGIFALFGAPVAHEDHPQRAVHAAIAARDDLRRRGEELRKQGSAGVEIRIGINTGEVVMRSVQTGGHTEYSPVGHVINLASRMQGAAPPDGIVVSEDTRRLVEGYFELRDLGPTEVKGVAEPIDVYEVTGTGASRDHFDLAAQRGLTKFVGRERELEQLQRALEQARAGNGQIVAVMAEAGTGKSRLFHEFKATLPSNCKVLQAYSVSHGKASAWLPVLELLRRYFGIRDTDDMASRREKMRAALIALDPKLGDTLPYLFGLLGIVEGFDPLAQMDPQIRRRRTLDAIKRVVLRESLNQPMFVIFEDLHWIDEQTQALLDLLADSVANSRVLLLVNYRPEYRHEWTNKSHYVQLGLNPLGRESAEELLTGLLGDGVELKPLKSLVVERTGGNPFFIEEIVKALFDEGVLLRDGAVKVTRSLSQLRLPSTVQGILASRIDRQPSEHKQLLQTLSVIGRESSLGLLTRVASRPDTQLERLLADLRAGEFIYEQSAATGVEYVFKHALTQEVAYNSLLIERRKQIHEQAGQALESIFADQLDDHLTQLAHHYSHSENIDKAIEYLGRAGQQALQRSAYDDAIGGLNEAIGLLQSLSSSPEHFRRELKLRLAVGPALIAIKGWSALEVEQTYTRAWELCERLDDPPESFPVLFGLYALYLLRAELRTAHKLAEQLLARAQNARNPAMLLLAHQALGQTSFQTGDLDVAREHLEMSISLYDRERDRSLAFLAGIDLGVAGLSFAGATLWALGYPDQALEKVNEALALARGLSHPHTLAFAESFFSLVSQFRREALSVRESSERGIALSTEHGFTSQIALASFKLGWATAELGRPEEGTAQIQEGLAAYRATRGELGRPYWLILLAEAHKKTGRLDDGLSALAEAGTAADKHEDVASAAEILRLKGELLLEQDNTNAAKALSCFQEAIEIARKQSAKSYELRATTSLARLLDKQSRRDEARALLADIYNWFTEGFDTADLKDTKALLDELSK
jgi:predicted ATPase/class 3 adenylate cyclase